MAEQATLQFTPMVLLDNYHIQWNGFSDSMEQFIMDTITKIKEIDMATKKALFDQVKE